MVILDVLEQRDPQQRQLEQLAQLQAQVAYARKNTDYFANSLANCADIATLDDLQKLPLVRKSDLMDLQKPDAPFAGMNAVPMSELKNLFLSPGPIAEPMGRQENEHRLARAMAAAGINANDRVLNCFSYHHTPAGLMFEGGATKIGCSVYPGGAGMRDDQIKAIQAFKLNTYVGTPDFLKLIIEKAEETGENLTSITKGLVSGGPFFPQLKDFYQSHNVAIKECYATADLGLIAYQDDDTGLVIDEDVIVEIVTPGTGNVVADGQVGEVVVTLLTNKVYPLIRFATGDLSMILPNDHSAKRTNKRLKGWLGRADQTCKVKGMFVHPKQIAEIIAAHSEIQKARFIVDAVDGQDTAILQVELAINISDKTMAKIAETVKNITKISAKVEPFKVGQLPNDGIIIEDCRSYE
ncbi:MAG: AMP-dependent synthetase [Hyphomicrobiales bacterium]|nr:MAG: AMP-dependent synthetase [Hyphomicrobiales bacterium]